MTFFLNPEIYGMDAPKKLKLNKRKPPVHASTSRPAGSEELIRLNKYLSSAGICSRREADQLIEAGAITVNGKVVKELGTKISPKDVVKYEGMQVRPEKKYYILVNKPKGYITTTDDPFERKTVMHLIEHAVKERMYPVGRLDRNTTGLLLFTNDGELAKRLTHPSHRIKKLYHVILDKKVALTDMEKIAGGVELEDGFIRVDRIDWVEGSNDRKEVGIEIHSGKNHIVKRIFEAFGYQVEKLDRVGFAGLTKKDLPRGKWRFLKDSEINFLMML